MQRAYGVLELRNFDDAKREIEGIATTVGTDLYGDVVESQGAQFKLPIPFLFQHDAQRPIGHVTEARPGASDIRVKVRLTKPEPGAPASWAERLDGAWADIKSGLVRGLSIGFAPLQYEHLEDGGRHFLSWLWLELSACTIPGNSACTVTSIKSLFEQQQAGGAIARRPPIRLIPAGRGPIKLISVR